MVKSSFAIFEKIFVVLGLFFSTDALIHLFSDTTSTVEISSGNYLMGLILGAVYGFSLLLIFIRKDLLLKKGLINSLRKNSFLFLFILFAFLSILWSASQNTALIRILGVFGATIFGIYIALRFNNEEKISLISSTLKIIILLSLIFIYLLPDYSVVGAGLDIWRGIFLFKNELGRIALLAFAVFSLEILSNFKSGFRIFLNLIFIVISVFFIIMSNTATALAVLPIVIVIFFFHYFAKLKDKSLRRVSLAIFFLMGIIFLIAILLNFNLVLEFLGRDDTLTGRTALWTAVVDSIKESPLVGYGFYGFWTGFNGAAGEIYPYIDPYTDIVHAHNGFLEITLDLGIIGLLLFALHLISVIIFSFKLAFIKKSNFGLFQFIYLIVFLLFNLTTVLILKGSPFYWIVYVVISLSIYLENDKEN